MPDPSMLKTPHLDHQYEQELAEITTYLLKMGNRAEGMVRDAVRALVDRDLPLARKVISTDHDLDQLEIATDALAVKLLARRVPVGEDLRLVTGALKMVTDLERVGDMAVNICKRALELSNNPGIEVLPEIDDLARKAIEEFVLAMQALRTRDSALARRLRRDDDVVDDANRAAFDRLILLAHNHPDQLERALSLSNVCKHLERVGDHAVNIAEMVVYIVEGEVLRHADP
jgi:phosphate transport system protein